MANNFGNGVANGLHGIDASAVENEPEDVVLAKINSALELIYNPHTSNQTRQEAQKYLEIVKDTTQGPSVGFALASNPANPPVVRHFGLSVLEHAIKHKWAYFSPDQASWIRNWVLELAQSVSRNDAPFLRNKVVLLWTELAKRCWGSEWMDMDEQLMQLWQRPGDNVHKELVLYVLETLSEEVFSGDDAVVALRESVLSKACVDIFTPSAVLNECFPNRVTTPAVRAGDDGWLPRISELLQSCLGAGVQNNDEARTCAVRALAVFTSMLPWAIPKAIVASQCVLCLCESLAAPNVAVQKAALEALHALYSRSHFTDDEFVDIVVPMYDSKYVDLYTRLFEWAKVDADDIDDDKYQFSKKFSEMLSCLGSYLDRRFSSLPPGVDVQKFVEFLLQVVQSESLVVSIPVLVTWTRLLNHRSIGPLIADTPLIGPLLEVCSSRLIRYESLPEDTQDSSYLFLLEDTDTIPERHAFLGNYRRYSSQVIETIVQLKLVDAFRHILSQGDNLLHHLYDNGQAMDAANYNKHSMPVLRVDAQFTVIESALKGYTKWRSSAASKEEQTERQQQQASLEAEFESWCNRLVDMTFEDPCIRKRILQLLVAFSITALDQHRGFMLKVLEHILVTWPSPKGPENRAFNDSVKELQSESMVELQRLATKQPDHLLNVYDQLEAKVKELVQSGTLDEKRQVAYQSFLFLIIHRAGGIDLRTRIQKLQVFLAPVQAQWQTPELERALSSYSGFCEMVGLDKAQEYVIRKRIDQAADWGSVELDAEGLALQADLEARQALLPLRSTKTFLTASVERLDRHSDAFQASCVLWQDSVPLILERLLEFLDHAHASHNHNNWTILPEEMRPSVGRLLTDRFWQSGISEGSKDDFYARVLDRKGTLEGLASSIRSTVRYVRETAYSILLSLSRFSVQFYSFNGLPGPLSQALFSNALYLPPHQIIGLLNLVRFLVDNCPVEFRNTFLPPLIASCFQQTSAKLVQEWSRIDQVQELQSDADSLTEEMKAESILRQFGYCAVIMMADFLDPTRINVLLPEGAQAAKRFPTLRRFCLMQTGIVEPLLLFCNNVIRIHDGRCCSIVLRVLRTIISEFVGADSSVDSLPPPPPAAPTTTASGDDEQQGDGVPVRTPDLFPVPAETAMAVREYLSSEVMKSCILSLHEPYFVDQHRELGSLIASILGHYCPLTATPRQVLLSLPDIKQEDVDFTIDQVCRPGMHTRQQRALVLDLLKDLKGVSVSEMGKLSKTVGIKRDSARGGKKSNQRSRMAQQFMTAPASSTTGRADNGGSRTAEGGRRSPDLEGVAGLFNLAE